MLKPKLTPKTKTIHLAVMVAFVIGFAALGSGLFIGRNGTTNPTTSASALHPADINDDGTVGISDLSILIGDWGTNDALSDINDDGVVNIFDLSYLISRWGAVEGTVTEPTMKMIGLGKPAYASAGTASNANDNVYDSSWSAGNSGWIAFDLSSELSTNRESIVLSWYSAWDDGFSVDSYDMSCPVWSGRPYLANYTVQVNGAPGGGAPPGSGWQTVSTVSGNQNLSKMHRINFTGYNWVRINTTNAPNGIDINVDIADASSGISDGWLFIGDSITAAYAGHFSNNDDTGTEIRSFTETIDSRTLGSYRPIQQNGAMACAHSGGYVGVIDQMLNEFHGKYVTLNLGTNDSWDGSGDPDVYKSTMETLVDKIKAKGKIPVIATIPWPNNGGSWDAQVAAFNAKIVEMYNEDPVIIRGPDIYTITKNKPYLYNGIGDVHFNDTGGAVARKAWADAAMNNIYGH